MLDGVESKGAMKKEDKQEPRKVNVFRSPARSTPQELLSPASQRGIPQSFRVYSNSPGLSASPQRGPSPALNSDDSAIARSPATAQDPMDLVVDGDLEQLKIFLLSIGVANIVNYIETEKFGSANESLLHTAVKFNRAMIVRYFRELGVSLELYNNLKETPLHVGAKFGRKETIAELFQFENALSLFDQKDSSGNSARFYAKSHRKEEAFSDFDKALFYNDVYDEEGPLLFAIHKAKNKYEKEQQNKAAREFKEEIENLGGVVSSKVSPYVMGKS